MSETCPTVTIQTENGPVDINECDFDPNTQVLWSGDDAAEGDDETQDDGSDPAETRRTGRKKRA